MAWLDKYFTSKNYGTIQDEGADVAPQPTLDFVGTGVTVTNDDANAKSIVTITAGGGSVDFDAVKDALAAADTAVDFNGQAITGLDDPTNAQDAATKAYVDANAGSVTASSSTVFTNKSISGSTNTLTNVAISTAVSGLGANVATFLATPSSANLRSALTDETGTGAAVFATGPTLSAPVFSTISNTGTLTLPTSTDTLVGRSTTDTLTNKTLTNPAFGSSNLTTTGNILAAGYFYTGSGNIASTGNIRLENTHKICARNNANSADVCFGAYSTGDTYFMGMNPAFGESAFGIIMGVSYSYYFAVASNYKIAIFAGTVEFAVPQVGYSSPYSVHGYVVTGQTDANYTVPASEYIYRTLAFSTACTLGRNITIPAPAAGAANAYYFTAINTTGQTLTFTIGSGTTKTLATNFGQEFRVTSAGVFAAGATFTP